MAKLRDRDKTLEFKGDIIGETEKAWLFDHDEASDAVWVPKSQCTWDNDTSTMTIPQWLAKEKELV
jgi:hypothetical protein